MRSGDVCEGVAQFAKRTLVAFAGSGLGQAQLNTSFDLRVALNGNADHQKRIRAEQFVQMAKESRVLGQRLQSEFVRGDLIVHPEQSFHAAFAVR